MNQPDLPPCRICQAGDGQRPFRVREMYFGSREEFDYFECGHCGTLQISEIPADLGRHYPDNYYSFSGNAPKAKSAFQRRLRRRRTEAWLGGGDAVGGLLARLSKRPDYLDWFAGLPLSTASRILDVGCGGGSLLLKLQRDGFSHLTGLDPFIAADIRHPGDLTIHKRELRDDEGRYDLIMLHHSFEHMVDPAATLAEIARHLAPGGRALLRLPVAGGYAWRKYRQHWYALDAPRHLFVPTVRAMHLLAAQAGLAIDRCFFDSDTGQFLASEAYMLDMPLIEQMRSPPRRHNDAELAALRAFARQLNLVGDGDSGGFILSRPADRAAP